MATEVPLDAALCRRRRGDDDVKCILLYTYSRPSTDSLLLQKSFSTRGSCTRESPAMYPAMTDSRQAGITSHAKQAPSAKSDRHRQECKNREDLTVLHGLGWDPKVLLCRVDCGFVVLVGKEYMVTCAVSTNQFWLRRRVSLGLSARQCLALRSHRENEPCSWRSRRENAMPRTAEERKEPGCDSIQ